MDPVLALSTPWLIALGLGYAAALAVAAVRTPWRLLAEDPSRQHLYFAAIALLMCLWWLRGSLAGGVDVYFLGVTALTLAFGWPLALLATLPAALGCAWVGVVPWPAVPWQGLTAGLVPVLVTHVNLRLLERLLPPNPFVYMLGGAFFGGALAAVAARLAGLGLLLAAGAVEGGPVVSQTLSLLILIALPEGIINGMVVSPLVAFRPQWLLTFDARRYFGG